MDIRLERILGLTVSNNASIDCDLLTSAVAYTAGCVVVLYNLRKNKQSHIVNSSRKTVTSLGFSWDGKYLITGECGHQPHVRIWEVQTCAQVAEFPGHKYGINCVAFSPNSKYVVSVGSQHDMIVNVWDWKNNLKVASNKVSAKVKALSFSADGSYFVTVGNRHVKFWYLDYSRTSKSTLEAVPLMGRSAILGDQRNNYFCDVGCGRGAMTESTFAITKSGLLCEFNSRRLLDKWVELKTSSANCISVGEHYICIGCAEGIIRCFNPSNLHFVCTLPRPHTLGTDLAKGYTRSELGPNSQQTSNAKYADALAITLDEENRKVTCVYSDHSMYFWDIRDMKRVGKSHSFLYHSACIWGVETYPLLKNSAKALLPPGTFFTCSSDDTIRIWNLETSNNNQDSFVYKRNIFSQELLKIIYMDPQLNFICDTDASPSGSSDKVDTTYDGKNGVRCLRISADGKQLASGDRSGNIRVLDLENQQDICKIEAHDAEVLCLEYSKSELANGSYYLSSASRDRLIHVFDVNRNYSLVQTLDDHNSSITAVRFVPDKEGKSLQLISCGADKSIIFRKMNLSEKEASFSREHYVVGKTTLYDMEVDKECSNVLTACQDRVIRLYSLQNGKPVSSFKGSNSDDGTLIKVVLDPSGLFLATSCTDKSLSIFDYQSGECLAVISGHSELITGLKFSQNGRHLISVSGDGCIFLWRLPNEMANAIAAKLGLPPVPPEKPPHIVVNKQFHVKNINEDKPVNGNGIAAPSLPLVASPLITGNANVNGNGNGSLTGTAEDANSSPYRFNMRSLPAWAKKQMAEESARDPTLEPNQVDGEHLQSKGRWGQRTESNESLVAKSYLKNSETVITANNILDSSQTKTRPGAKSEGGQISEVVKDEAGKDRVPPGAEFSSSSGSMRSDDDDVNMTDSSDLVYYPQSEGFRGSSFEVRETTEEELRDKYRKFRKNKSGSSRYLGIGLMPSVSVPNFNELHSDDEDSGTPGGDSDKSETLTRGKNPLYMSTENLDRIDQREKFLKSNFETLDKDGNEKEGKKSGGDVESHNSRSSISAKHMLKSPAVNPPTATPTPTPQTSAGNRSLTSTTAKPPISKRREELTKAISQARKKLETLGWKGHSLSNSKSVANLRDIGDISNKASSDSGSSAAFRRSISLSDLSFTPQRKLLPATPVPINLSNGFSAPLWDQGKQTDSSNSSQGGDVVKKSTSSTNLNQSDSMSSKVHFKKGPWGTPSPLSLSAVPSQRHISGRASAPPQQLRSKNKLSLRDQDSSDDESSASSVEPFSRTLRPGTPPKPSILRQLRRSSTSQVVAGNKPSNEPSSASSKTRRLWDNFELRSSKSEYNLSFSGREQLNPFQGPRSRSNSSCGLWTTPTDQLFDEDKFDLSSSNPAAVPLTGEVCQHVIDELNHLATYAKKLYQRASKSGNAGLCHLLVEGISKAYVNLETIVPPPGTAPSFPLMSNHSEPGNSLPPENMMNFLQQYSDRLLNMVEQRINKDSSKV